MPTLPMESLCKFGRIRGNVYMDVDQGGNTTLIQISTLFSPSGPMRLGNAQTLISVWIFK